MICVVFILSHACVKNDRKCGVGLQILTNLKDAKCHSMMNQLIKVHVQRRYGILQLDTLPCCCVRSDVVFVKVLSMSFHARFLIRPRFYKNIRLKVLGHMLGRSTVGHFWSSVKPLFPKNSHSSSSPDAHAQLGKTAW